MATIDGLFQDLCSAMPAEEVGMDADQAAGLEVGAALPTGLISKALQAWLIAKVRELTCSEKEVIRQAVQRFLVEKVRNQTLAAILSEVADAVLDLACPA